jgi:hypothetical protein
MKPQFMKDYIVSTELNQRGFECCETYPRNLLDKDGQVMTEESVVTLRFTGSGTSDFVIFLQIRGPKPILTNVTMYSHSETLKEMMYKRPCWELSDRVSCQHPERCWWIQITTRRQIGGGRRGIWCILLGVSHINKVVRRN